MNKQEAIKKIDRTLSLPRPIGGYPYDYEDGLRYAKDIINQINEPERVKLTKTQEDYLLGFGDIKNKESEDWTAALYYIIRVGWGYLFTTAPGAGNDEIPLNSDYYKKLSGNLDVDDLKTLLIKALVNGYEVEKKKLYTAKLKIITNGDNNYLNKYSDTERFTLSNLYTASGAYQTSFSRSELEQLNVWDNPVFEIKEADNEMD